MGVAASLMRCLTKLKWALLAWLFVLPWLIGAAFGPVTQIGAWLATGLALAAGLFFQSGRFLPLSLLIAAALSLCIAGLQYVGWADLSPWVAEAAPGEMLGNLRQRNQLASLLAMGWLALVLSWRMHAMPHFAADAKHAGHEGHARLGANQILFILACALAALLGVGNALSGSRTGFLQWLAVAGLLVVWHRHWVKRVNLHATQARANDELLAKKSSFLLGAACLGYALGVIAAPWLSDGLGHANAGLLGRADDSNAFSRLALWRNTLELIWREPLMGHGWRSLAYAHYSTEFSGARFMEMLDNAHNLPLHLAVELGLPVAIAFCGLVIWLIFKNKPWQESQPDRQLACGCLLMIGIHSMLEYPLWYGPFFMTAVICIGVLCRDAWKDLEQKWALASMKYAHNAINLIACGVASLLLVFTAFVAFDYHRVSQIYLAAEERSAGYAADPLAAAKKSVFFQNHAKFAELQITQLSKASAPRVLELSSELVRWSPEPRIIEKLIESAVMLGRDDLAAFHWQRYRVAYPAAYAQWLQRQK